MPEIVKGYYTKVLLILFFAVNFQLINSQQINTLYFMENMPLRHTLNPAFQPDTKYYISIPLLGNINLGASNNAVTLQDIIYNHNGRTITFLDEDGNVDKFYNKLKSTTAVNAFVNVNLFSFGFKHENSFWNLSLTQKLDGNVLMPKDVFKLALYGTPDMFQNNYNLTNLQSSVNYYTEAALGYSQQIDEQWTVGAKVKFLYGTANVTTSNDYFTLNAGLDKWQLKSKGTVNFAGEIEPFNNFLTTKTFSIKKPSGLGAGIDLGAQLRLTSDLYLSASITDLGFITWNKNITNTNYSADYLYDGIAHINGGMDLSTLQSTLNRLGTVNPVVDSLVAALQNSIQVNQTNNSYRIQTNAKLNLGAEYKFLSNKLSVGLLYRQIYSANYINHEITTSVNAVPYDWLNASLSYSVLNGSNTFGAGLGVRTGFIHWFAALDYLPLRKTTLKSLSIFNTTLKNIPLPYNTKSSNFSIGVNIVFDEFIHQKYNLGERNKREVNSRTGLFRTKFNNGDNCNCGN
ncbi:MAG: DUF5723 family protein [Paludibacter sp.]|nr:DUF5723 family protein [Paludibacter sp.]